MDEVAVLKAAYAMPLSSPSYPPGPYRFTGREYMIITYRTDLDALKRVVPEPLEVVEPIVKCEFIRMPDSTGFGDYTESGQVIPVRIRGEASGYVHFMFLNDHPPVAPRRPNRREAMSTIHWTSSAPNLTTEQMVEVDRAMIEDYRIELIQMMENAGRNLAHLARMRFLDGDPRGLPVVVLAGSGGNGGGALVAARRLSNWGADVTVVLGQPPGKMTAVPGHQLDILRRMGVHIVANGMPPAALSPAVVLDGLIGY